MPDDEPDRARSLRGVAAARLAGIFIIVLSLVATIVGLFLTTSLADDVRATVSVSRSAVEAVDQTLLSVEVLASDAADSLDAAAGGVDSISNTVDDAVAAIDSAAEFMEEDLPTTIESIQMSMPAAIQTANAIDGTLRALSLFGVDYDPEEPFGESLARVNTALSSLPEELRGQSESFNSLVPSAEDLGGQTDRLSDSLATLTESLEGFTTLNEDYQATLAGAQAAIEQAESSVETTIWMLRGLLIALALSGLAVGLTLIAIGNSLDTLVTRTENIEMLHEEPIKT